MTTYRYRGGKNRDGVYQTIINQLPPHDIYGEIFLGSGAITRRKRPAIVSIGMDDDAMAIARFPANSIPNLTLLNMDALAWLKTEGRKLGRNALLYVDPPYLGITRRQKGKLYRKEFKTKEQHTELLEILLTLNCMVAISGYWSELYAQLLKDWRSIHYQTTLRYGIVVTEYLWMNYEQPFQLHDYQYLGANYRQRERIRKKRDRWRNKFAGMVPMERYAIFAAIEDLQHHQT